MRSVFLGLVATLTMFAAPAWAADTKAPEILHVKIERTPQGEPLKIRARITDESEVFAPSVYVRSVGGGEFNNIEMTKVVDGYEATVPASQMSGPVEYFIEAFDEHGNGPARSGSPEEPTKVDVFDPATEPADTPPVLVPVPPPPAPPPPPNAVIAPQASTEIESADKPVTSKWWFWTVVGVGVAAVAAGAVVAATQLSSKDPVDMVIVEVFAPDPTSNVP